MKTKRESKAEVLARRAPAPAMGEERVAAEGASAGRKKFQGVRYFNKPRSMMDVLHHLSLKQFKVKAPPREPQQDLAPEPETKITFLRSSSPWERLGLRAPALAPEPEAGITSVRSNKPKPFSIRDFALGSRRVLDPLEFFARPNHIKPVPEELMDCACSSQLWISNRRHMMPRTRAVPTKAPTACTSEGLAGDNFTPCESQASNRAA